MLKVEHGKYIYLAKILINATRGSRSTRPTRPSYRLLGVEYCMLLYLLLHRVGTTVARWIDRRRERRTRTRYKRTVLRLRVFLIYLFVIERIPCAVPG